MRKPENFESKRLFFCFIHVCDLWCKSLDSQITFTLHVIMMHYDLEALLQKVVNKHTTICIRFNYNLIANKVLLVNGWNSLRFLFGIHKCIVYSH